MWQASRCQTMATSWDGPNKVGTCLPLYLVCFFLCRCSPAQCVPNGQSPPTQLTPGKGTHYTHCHVLHTLKYTPRLPEANLHHRLYFIVIYHITYMKILLELCVLCCLHRIRVTFISPARNLLTLSVPNTSVGILNYNGITFNNNVSLPSWKNTSCISLKLTQPVISLHQCLMVSVIYLRSINCFSFI